MGPEEKVQVAYVARRYFIDGRTRIEIGDELGLSRFKVARMLEIAREQNIVNITIDAPGMLDDELSAQLQSVYGLQRAVVVRTGSDDPNVIRDAIGSTAAELLSEVVVEGDLLGVTAGRTLSSMAQALTRLPSSDIVQLTGVAGPIQDTGVEITRRISEVSGGEAHSIFAPLVLSDVRAAESVRRQPVVAETIALFESVTRAVVAIGSWRPPDSQVYDNAAITPKERDQLLKSGVVAEVCSTLITQTGSTITDLDPRCVSITATQMRQIPEIIGAAGGARKTAAVAAALASGLVTSLVTDAALARRLLGKSA